MDNKEKLTAEEIVKEIFYSQATNGKAEKSIANGIKLVEEYASQQRQVSEPVDREGKSAINFYNWLHMEGYSFSNKPYRVYFGGKYYWIQDIYKKYITTKK